MIFTSLLSSLIRNNVDRKIDLWWETSTSRKTATYNTEGADYYNSSISTDFFDFTLNNTIKPLVEVILSLLTVFLVYYIVKLAMDMGWDKWWFVSKQFSKFNKMSQDLIWSVPSVPVPSHDEKWQAVTRYLSVGSISDEFLNKAKVHYTQKLNIDKQKDLVQDLFRPDAAITLSASTQTEMKNVFMT